MKKALSVFMMVVLMLGVLSACGPKRDDSATTKETTKEEASAKPEKLIVWEDKDKSGWLEKVAADFEKEHGIKVEVKEVEMATKMRDQLRLDGPAGTGPDVVTLPHDQIGQVANEGLIAELKLDASVTDKFSQSSIDAETYDGKLYAKQSINVKKFVENMNSVLHMYPSNVNEVAFNLVGSHDTPRILTECGEDVEKVKQIFTIMLTFLGTPCIYYGDEIGFTGTQDPGCRKCMEWDETKQNRELFDHIQRLIHLRKQYPLLANEGEFFFVTPHEDDVCLAYTKTNGEKTAIVIVNTSNAEQNYTLPGFSSGKKVKNLWNDEEVFVSQTNHVVSLTANGFAILEY